MAALDAQTLTPAEEEEVRKWITTAEQLKIVSEAGKMLLLDALNAHLASRTTILGTKPSKADTSLYLTLAPIVKAWSPKERTGKQGRPHVVRHIDFIQHSPVFGLDVPDADKVPVDAEQVLYVKPPVDARAEKERLKREKAAVAQATASPTLVDRTKEASGAMADKVPEVKDKFVGDKTQKFKKNKPKQTGPPPAPAAFSPCLIDLRVGHILKATKHPEADSLYVSIIAMGDAPGTDDTAEHEGKVVRTVCSGLNGLVPLEEMQGRKVVVVANLKPVKMRGVKSCAMVLAASPKRKEGETDDHKGPVELVRPPADAKAGERVFFEGWKGDSEKVLNPKKKVWETFQPAFTTNESLEVVFDAGAVKELDGKQGFGKLVAESGGVCTVKSLQGAQVR